MNAISTVNMVTLPVNIVKISISLLAGWRLLVIPKLKPVVLYAEKHSKVIFRSEISGLNKAMVNVEIPTTMNDKVIIAKALLMEVSGISLLESSSLFFPLDRLKKFKVAIAKVDVLIPPPVEEGEAPIHIKKIVSKIVPICNCVISTALNPAVLGVVP